MPNVSVRNLENKVVGTLELDPEVFAYKASETLLWEAVNAYRASRRKGTHAVRGRSQVAGGGHKVWRQKGTGRARMGTIRSPLWKGGGIAHGPRPRDYTQAFPKKKRRGAIKMALSDKLGNDRLIVVEELALESHRTRDFVGVLKALGIERKALVVDDRENRNLYLGSRNLPQVKMVPTLAVNVYDLLAHDHLLISKQSLLELQALLKQGRIAPAEALGDGQKESSPE